MKKTEQKVIDFIRINKLIDSNDKILVAFSGGPDSTFILHFLNKYQNKYKIEIKAIHFNHKLRSNESDKEETAAKELCETFKIPFESKSLNVKSYSSKHKISIEEAARILRYKNLESYCKEYNFTKIVTAHTLDDNTETVLMNLTKGTGISGLSGIPVIRNNIIRPLLSVSKPEIINYLNEASIVYSIDSSNLTDDYQRNFIRNQIIPLFKKINPSFNEAVSRSITNLEDSKDALNFLLSHFIVKNFIARSDELIIPINSDSGDHESKIFGTILREVFKLKLNYNLEYKEFKNIEKLLHMQKGKKFPLKSGFEIIREEKSILVRRTEKRSQEKEIELQIGKSVKIGSMSVSIVDYSNKKIDFAKNGSVEFIDGEHFERVSVLRYWKDGDKFQPIGMKTSKKVSDFLTDLKVPASERKNKLVLVNRNNIAWIVGLRISERYKIGPNSKKIYKLEVK